MNMNMSQPVPVPVGARGGITSHSRQTWVVLTIFMLVISAFVILLLPGIIAQANCNGNPACQTTGTTGNQCFLGVCITGTSGATITVYSTRSASGQITVNAVMNPGTPTTTGEVKSSCNWIFCSLDGDNVNIIVTVSDTTGGTALRSTSYQFRLGLGDSETYVISIPALTNGDSYTATVQISAQTITAGLRAGTLSTSVTWPISAMHQIGTWSS